MILYDKTNYKTERFVSNIPKAVTIISGDNEETAANKYLLSWFGSH